ncbi:hypothetical protein RintRC_4011 [Richelia intracellularis]|nr:hypothetical protein RintRC_4011 [Richelia intracellularis]
MLDSPRDRNIWGWEIDKIYQDLGERSQLQQLLQDCQSQPPDYLLVIRLEELGDTVQQVSDALSSLEQMGIVVIALEQPYSSENPHSRQMLWQLLQSIQDEQQSRRIRQGHARKRLQAAPPPGRVPYGYKRGKDKYILDRSTSPIIKDFFEYFILYASLRGAVRHLVRKYGKKISVTTGKRWLINPVYRGDTAYHHGTIIADTHTPIISREEAAQVDRILRRNSSLAPRTASAPRSLAGLVICGECNSSTIVTHVTIRHKEKEYLYLRPANCTRKPKCRAIPYQQILDQTIIQACNQLPLAIAGVNFPQLDAVKDGISNAIAHQQQILEQLPGLVETGVLDPETAQLRAYKLRTEISSLQGRLAALPPVNLLSIAQAVSIPQFWLDLSESERRFYLREFIHHIKIIRQGQEWDLEIIFVF